MSTFQLASRRVFLPPLRRSNAVNNVSRRSMMAFEDHARLRGKFEEERYQKQQQDKWVKHLRELRAQEGQIRRQEHHEQFVEPVKKAFADLLATTGDTISDEGLENLAKSRHKDG